MQVGSQAEAAVAAGTESAGNFGLHNAFQV